MTKETIIYIAYFGFYHEAVKKEDMTICIRPYGVSLDQQYINDDGSINASTLHDCRDLVNDITHKSITLKPFKIEAYSNIDSAIKEVERYAA